MNDEITHKLFTFIEQHPNLSQPELAREMGISLGKTNCCIKGPIERSLLKARNFKNSNNKIAFAYMLTPTGLSEKAKITARYLKHKVHEYETLKIKIDKLRQQVSES